jgi:hypothetical protein
VDFSQTRTVLAAFEEEYLPVRKFRSVEEMSHARERWESQEPPAAP